MSCPLCGPLGAVEGPLVNHLLRHHPEAQATAALGLSIGTLVLHRRPEHLVGFYVIVLIAALFLTAAPGTSRN